MKREARKKEETRGPRGLVSPPLEALWDLWRVGYLKWATRAVQELLQVPSRRMEVQSFFSSLFLALLFQISFFVLEAGAEISQDEQHVAEWVDPISSTVEALKTLMQSCGYGDHVSSIQRHGGWGLLVNPERHYDGVTLLARSLVINNCWHNRPLFSSIIRFLQDPDCKNHLTALVLLTELLQCPDVAAVVDDISTRILANWFRSEEPATVKLLLQMLEVFAKHGNMVKWGRGRGCALRRPCHQGKEHLVCPVIDRVGHTLEIKERKFS
ncbi:maestro heat-like repeat-containing protein family member 6 [Saimiri boliviensis]|uniref:maestro heat-like repeat-containing protein family member 6 n=1 Tax=Saimiri boliviensis TaxID=27679 RepID=UPI003D776021